MTEIIISLEALSDIVGKEIKLSKYDEVVTRCKDCEYHGKRTNICDIFHCHTNPNGYCHKGRIYGQTESGSESK